MAGLPLPRVRTILLCEDIVRDAEKPKQFSLLRVITNSKAVAPVSFPCHTQQLCVFSQLTECRGQLAMRIDLHQVDSGKVLYSHRLQSADTGKNDPLSVRGLAIKFQNVIFPSAGLYGIRLWLGDTVLAEHPLLVQ